MTDQPLSICPECGGHIRRVLYPAGIVFKGAGFYKTDHGNGAVPAVKDANGEAKKSEEKSTTASESKPAENGTSAKSEGESKSKTSQPSKPSAAAAAD